jgi:hypothetical protein
MKTNLAALACLSGLALTASSARAVTFSFDASPDTGATTGKWAISFTTTDYTTWLVTATAGVPTPGSANPTFADQIQFRVLDKTSPFQNPFTLVLVPLTGQTQVGASSARGWQGFGVSAAAFSPTAPAAGRLGNSLGDLFTGSFTLASPQSLSTIGTVEARLSGGAQSWYGFTSLGSLAPEPPSVCLLLLGLLPLGMLLGKSRQSI